MLFSSYRSIGVKSFQKIYKKRTGKASPYANAINDACKLLTPALTNAPFHRLEQMEAVKDS